MLTEFVFPFLITVLPMLKTEIVLNASKDMILNKEDVFSHLQIMLNLQIWDVELGIGKTKSA